MCDYRTDIPETAIAANVWAVSLAFWSTLLVAALLYAAVALSPKLLVWLQIRHEYLQNARQLIALEAEVDYLERVQQALETDPEFLERLAASALPTGQASDNWVPVQEDLIFGQAEAAVVGDLPADEPAPGLHLLTILASDRPLRTGLLAAACLLVVLAFTFLNDAGAGLVRSVLRTAQIVLRLPLARYVRKPSPTASASLTATTAKVPPVLSGESSEHSCSENIGDESEPVA